MIYFFESFIKPGDVDTLGFYDYIYWNEEKILSIIIEELSWRSAEDASTIWCTNDKVYPLINYIYYYLVGFTEYDEIYSKMICEGQISREKALDRVYKDYKSMYLSLIKSLNELEVDKKVLDSILKNYRNKLLKQIL